MNQYLALIIGAYLAFSANQFQPFKLEQGRWEQFKLEHGKTYESANVELMRKAIFAHNMARASEYMKQVTVLSDAEDSSPSFEVGVTSMADLSEPEMQQLNGFRLPRDELTGRPRLEMLRNSPQANKFLAEILDDTTIEVPDELDWRTVSGRVSGVKNQGSCGSCWAFAATGALEGQEKVRLERMKNATSLIELSEQNLVDCVKDDAGCNGGLMADAYNYIHTEGGIDDEISYPYEARTRKCRFNKAKSVLSDAGATILPVGDEQKLKEVVAKFGPVAVAIDASSLWFQLYRKGVYVNKRCKNKADQLDHGVLVVGYGTDPKKGDYWLVKNSWGAHWGEKGYIRMARNQKNMCGIATVATIPTF